MVRYVLRWDVAYGHFGEVVQNVEAMNAIRRDRGWSEWVPWAPLSGKANQIVLICDGPDVATILAETDAGYADADYVYVAAPIGGQLSALNVIAGQQVAKGKPLFALDDEAEKAAREEANAKLAAASYQAAATEKGKREPEVNINQAQPGTTPIVTRQAVP